MTTLPLEDNYEDIIGKAMRGLSLTVDELASRAGMKSDEVAAQMRGEFSEKAARALAPVLGLDVHALVASGKKAWYPEVPLVPGVRQFTTTWKDLTVNSYVAWDDNGDAAIFDTGADAAPILEAVAKESLRVRAICITHSHGDHIADLEKLRRAFPEAPVFASSREPIADAQLVDEGKELRAGDLHVETRLTWGHSPGGITYVIRGLGRPVAIVGDALFAGSMGGGGVSWRDALATNRKNLFTLPDETAVCPGHGPITTIEQEKKHNPFYPEFKEG
jgi:hydroxyacylglutathione hydrolase